MKMPRTKAITNEIRGFCSHNKKLVICFSIIFVFGIVVGIISQINGCNGQFVRLAKVDMQFGAVKVFFFSGLFLALAYFIILLSTMNPKAIFLSVLPFVLFGVYFGKYMCVLVACYSAIGLLNLFLIYIPFFLVNFMWMLLAAIWSLSCCNSERSLRWKIRPALILVLKAFFINIAINFVVILIIGSMVKVIVVVV